MTKTETPDGSKVVIKVEEEIDGDQIPTRNYRFSKIGEPVPINSDADFKFDMDSLPSRPLAVSERFGVIFVAHSSGFCVARTKDVLDIAEELKKGGKGSCIQERSVVDIPLGKVSILALSADSSMLAASVGFNLYFFSVTGLLNKDHEPSFSKSLDGSSCIKDMQWSPHLEDHYVVLTRDGNLYRGSDQDDLQNLTGTVDAVNWSMNGKYLAVAKDGYLSILSSKFEEKLRIKLLFDSLVDDDPDCAVKVDSIRWVRPDCIMLGCHRVNADGKEENYVLQLITVKDGKITNPSSNPVALNFSDGFLAINDDDIPSGTGPYTFVSYLDEFELAFVANKKSTDQHIVLFNWSTDNENGAEQIEILNDSWVPTINLQANSDDDNLILGLAIGKVDKDEKISFVCGEVDTEVSPCCILLCLSVDGKLFMFHFASAIGPSVLPEDSNSVSDEESPPISPQHPVTNIINNEKQSQSQKVKVNESNEKTVTQLFKDDTQQENILVSESEPVNPVNQEITTVKPIADFVSKSANDKSNKTVSTELSVNNASIRSDGSSGSFSSGSLFSSSVFGTQSFSSSGSFSSGGMFSLKTFDVKSPQPPYANVQEKRPDTSVGTTHFSSGSQKFSLSKMTSGPSTSSSLLPQGASAGAAVTKSMPVVSNQQLSVGNFFDFKVSDKGSVRNNTSSRPLNSEPNISEQRSVEEMAKELDALLDSIEGPSGSHDASIAAHKPSVEALEEGIWVLSDRCRKGTDMMHQGIEEVQLLLDKTVQVLARKIYMEAIVKQATDSQYLDIWNRQKLSSELDMKRRHILEINQNLTNQLIELERHLNTVELQRFGDKSDVQMNRKSLHTKHNPPRHVQSLQSLHNTMNAQLTAAEKLSECLSKQMAVLSIDTEPVKKQNVKKELFDTIGISYDATTTFSSPGQQKSREIPPKSQLLISSYTTAVNTDLKKSQLAAVKSFEPETARRRRDSLDKSWASIEPSKTTVKRMLLQEDRQTSPVRLSSPIGTRKNNRLTERSVVSLDIPHGALNMSQSRGSHDVQIKRPSEGQLNSSLWSNHRSDSSKTPVNSVLSLGSVSQSTPIVTRDTAKDTRNLTTENARKTFTLKSDPVKVNDPKSSQQFQSFPEPSSNTLNTFQKKPTDTSSIWSKKSLESPFSSVSSATSSTAFSGRSFSLEAFTRESQSSTASLPVPVTLAPSLFSFKDTTSSSTSATSLNNSSTSFGLKLGATQTTPLPARSLSFPSFPSTVSSDPIKPSVNIEVKSDQSKLNPDTSQTSKPNLESVPKFDFKPIENPSGQTSETKSRPSTDTISESQLKVNPTTSPVLVSNSKLEQPLVSPAVFPPSISNFDGPDLAVTQEDEMEEEAPDTTQLTLGNLGGFGLGSSPNPGPNTGPNPSAPKQNPFGAAFGNAAANTPIVSFTASPPSSGLFRPASFNVESQQPLPPPQQSSFGGFTGGFGGNNNQSSGGQGFGQPARIGSGQQALGSVLGSFGQSRQFGTGLPGSVASTNPFGGGFGGGQSAGGFATASAGGSGFANLASGGGGFGGLATGGGGFGGAPATGGGFGGAPAAGGGFGGAPAAGGGFGGAPAAGGGFGGAPAAGGGFGGASAAGGGFGGAPSAGGGFGGAASGGFGGFSSQGGSGFSTFGSSSGGTARPPSELFTQMRK